MKIFISWSGERSQAIARALYDWLPLVIQAIEPFMSSEDVDKGTRWADTITKELEACTFGVICLTSDNLDKPWLHFEAGALSRYLQARVAPFLFDLKKEQVGYPLAMFQVTSNEQSDVLKMIQSINNTSENPLSEAKLTESFLAFWPRLKTSFETITSDTSLAPKRSLRQPTEREMLVELLELVRGQGRVIAQSLASTENSFLRNTPFFDYLYSGIEPAQRSLLEDARAFRQAVRAIGLPPGTRTFRVFENLDALRQWLESDEVRGNSSPFIEVAREFVSEMESSNLAGSLANIRLMRIRFGDRTFYDVQYDPF